MDWLDKNDFLPTLSSHFNSRIFVYGVKPSYYRRVRGMMLIWPIVGGYDNSSLGKG